MTTRALEEAQNGAEMLMEAVAVDNMERVRGLVRGGASVNWKAAFGGTALIAAAMTNNVDAARFLIDGGADADAVDNDGWTALIYAADKSSLDVVRYLVDRGADVNAADYTGKTALMHAVENGNTDVVRSLVGGGADVDAVDSSGKTMLMFASDRGGVEVVRFFVDGGANLNAVSKNGSTALMYALGRRRTEIAGYLVSNGADVNAVDNDEKTMLMHASERGRIDIVQYLVGGGAEVNTVDKTGVTALMYTSQTGNMDILRYLVGSGAHVGAVDDNGKTMLMYASERGSLDAMRYLVDAGADVNAVENDGKTALMYVSAFGSVEAVQFLVDRGADVNCVNRAGRTAMFFAASHDHAPVQRMLLPLIQRAPNTIDSGQEAAAASTSRSSRSWFVSPFDIDLEKRVNRGSVGAEFRAKWLDADVVVKLFIPDASMATFSDEVTVWRQLRHPNVIKLYGACDVGHHFFVSEFASNGSLVEHLAACRHTDTECTPWKFLHEAALGLAYLHERNVVHGNLRGSNILIGSDGLAKLAEFGLSGSVRSDVPTGVADAVFGSTRWQSPERVLGGEASFASDVYSLGLCIVEVVTGNVPWEHQCHAKTMLWKEDWDPVTDARSENAPGHLTSDVCDLMIHMCARNPEQRVTASVAGQMLGRLAAKEHAEYRGSQPEAEPQVSIDEYKGGEVSRLRDKLQGLILRYPVGNVQRHAFDEVQAIYERIGRSNQPWKQLEQIHKLLIDAISVIQPDIHQNQIQRLASTLANGVSMDGIQRRVNAMWAMLEGFQPEEEARELRRREQQSKQRGLFVSEVSQTVRDLSKMEEADLIAFLGILDAETNARKANYTEDQLAVIQSARDQVGQRITSDVSATTPKWFLPWYELEVDNSNCVGAGGFGGVYRARWLDSEVVVKLLNPVGDNSASDDSFASTMSSYWTTPSQATTNSNNRESQKKMREMFAREVSVWFGLSHPHVVRLFGACHIGTQFFACEYATNGSLDKYLCQHPDELWQKLHEAALGVQYLHSRGIVHGDLKCNNILMGGDEKAKVTDFGLSSDAALLDKPQVSGAWQWVAPECLEHGSSQLSSASDIYALGMCIVEAVRVVEVATLQLDATEYPPLPWGNLGNAAVKYHVVREEALPLRPQLCTDDQWALVTRMCVTDPSRRLKISTVVDELEKLANGQSSGKAETETSTNVRATTLEPVAAVITQMKGCIRMAQDTISSEHKTLSQIFGLLWDRLDHMSSVITADGCDVESLRGLVERVKESTTKLPDVPDTLIQFTEMAMRGYALHRSLEKLMETNFWRTDGEGDEVHDWKPRCNEFLGLADRTEVSDILETH